jgi:hypothetical protein
MKNIRIAVFLFAFLFASGVFATQSGAGQGQGHQTPSVDDHLKVLSERLNLSQDQQARIKIILEGQLAQMYAIRKNEFLSQDDRMSKLRSLREASAAKVRVQLDDEQKKKFDDMRQDMRGRIKERQTRGEDCSMIWMAVE